MTLLPTTLTIAAPLLFMDTNLILTKQEMEVLRQALADGADTVQLRLYPHELPAKFCRHCGEQIEP